MRPVTVTAGPLAAASATAVCASQTPTAAFTINGSLAVNGVATMDNPRRVLVTTTANETGKNITVVGTGWSNEIITEIIAAPNAGTAQSNMDFRTVTAVSISAAAAGAITVGNNGVASSMWARMDEYAQAQTALQCIANGTVNYTVQTSMQDPNSPTNPVAPYLVNWSNSPDATVVAATATQASLLSVTPTWVKVTLNSGSGSVSMVVAQAGVAPY